MMLSLRICKMRSGILKNDLPLYNYLRKWLHRELIFNSLAILKNYWFEERIKIV